MEVFTKKFGPVRYPEEILFAANDVSFYETPAERLEEFYKHLLLVMDERETERIDYMMTWEYTHQGREFWRKACYCDCTWAEFMETEAYALLKYAKDNMFSVVDWSLERVKELM